MKTIKNILVATDFSNDAYAALFYATRLFGSRACTFYILNVFDELTPLEGKKSKRIGHRKRLEQKEISSKEKLVSTFHKIVLDNENDKHQFHTISKKGNLAIIMKKAIDDYKIDLVVMGSKGNTGAKEIFLGSNTIQAANTIENCSILAVPTQFEYKALKEIAFVTDLKKDCAKKSIAPLLFLSTISKSSVRVLHITEKENLNVEQESHRKLVDLCLNDIDHSFHWVQEYADKAIVIDRFLEQFNIDMFAMIQHKRSFFERLLREPVIKDVSMYVDIPFLILPEQN